MDFSEDIKCYGYGKSGLLNLIDADMSNGCGLYRHLINCAKLIVKNYNTAEEVVAHTLCNVVVRKFEDISSVTIDYKRGERYLLTMCENLSKDYLRRKKALYLEDCCGENMPEKKHFQDAVEEKDLFSRVVLLIGNLPFQEKSILELRCSEKTYKEIGEYLGLNEKTVGTKLRRIRMKLKQKIN